MGGGGDSHQRTERGKVALAPSGGSGGDKEETRVSWLETWEQHLTPFSLHAHCQEERGRPSESAFASPMLLSHVACHMSPQQDPRVVSWLLGTCELPEHKAWSLLFCPLCGALVSGECYQGAQKGGALRSSESLTPSQPASALLEA